MLTCIFQFGSAWRYHEESGMFVQENTLTRESSLQEKCKVRKCAQLIQEKRHHCNASGYISVESRN